MLKQIFSEKKGFLRMEDSKYEEAVKAKMQCGLGMEYLTKVARSGYVAYGDFRNWRTHDDKRMPRWDEVSEEIREAWRVVAAEILNIDCRKSVVVNEFPLRENLRSVVREILQEELWR